MGQLMRRCIELCRSLMCSSQEHKYLPDDVVVQILLRLPVKTIGRCMCVCRAWRSLITADSSFLKKQFLLSHSAGNDESSSNYVIFQYGGFTLLKTPFYYFTNSLVRRMVFPIAYYEYDELFQVMGSCNGVVCLVSYSYVILWNPTIQKVKLIEIPKHLDVKGANYRFWFGFGYAPETDDYKVVIIECQHYKDFPTVGIYSTKTNSWKETTYDNIHYKLVNTNFVSPAPFVKGSLHWLAFDMEGQPPEEFWHPEAAKSSILCFDIHKEVFHNMDFPFDGDCSKHMTIKEFQDSLACFVIPPRSRHWEVWVMKDYGLPQSWTKIWKLADCVGNPLEIMNNGEIIANAARRSRSVFGLYDPATKLYREVKAPPWYWSPNSSVPYKESLGLLDEEYVWQKSWVEPLFKFLEMVGLA